MIRRRFLSGMIGGVWSKSLLGHLGSFPALDPTWMGSRRESTSLGQGITLVDYRIYSGARKAIIGEIRNDSKDAIDSPTVSVVYPRVDGDMGFAWLPATMPTMKQGESVPIFGVTDEINSLREQDSRWKFSLCTAAAIGPFTEAEQSYSLETQFFEGENLLDAYTHYARIENVGDKAVSNLVTRGFVRDSLNRIAGVTPLYRHPTIDPGKFRWATVTDRNGEETNVLASPFPLLSDDNYSVTLRPGPHLPDRATNRGCDFGFPWD